jgi:MFS family permease
MAEAHDPYAALRLPDYRRLLACGVLASIATQILEAAIGWDLYHRTNSATALGFVGLAEFLPVLLLSLPAGHVADRYNRKVILAGAVLLTALAAGGLAALSFLEGPVPLVFVFAGFVGVFRAFYAPARWALLPAVVPDELLANAVTWNSSAWQVAATLGPALGGAGLAAASGRAGYVYALAGTCALVSAGLATRLRPRPTRRRAEEMTLGSLLAGLRFVFRTDLILAAMTLDLFAVLLGGATALLPVYASDILGVGPAWYGWLRAAPSLGALVTALAMAHRPPMRQAGPALLGAVAGFGAATVVFGLSRNPALSFAMLALTGALDNVSVVVRGTLVQTLTPDAMRGRVASVNLIFIGSSNELGAFESGVTAGWFGPVVSVVGGGLGAILVVVAVMLQWPAIARLGSLAGLSPSDDGVALSYAVPEEPRPGTAAPAVGASSPPEELSQP